MPCKLTASVHTQPRPPTINTPAGYLLGTRQTLLETFDGGKTWEPRTIEVSHLGPGLGGALPWQGA